jgi:outer membrane receptor for ferrienterochelin and colicins
LRVLITVLCLAAVAVAGEIEIRVKDSTGGAIPSAEARLRTRVGGVLRAGNTDAQGSLVLRGIDPGHYGLEISKDGFQPYRLDVEFGEERQVVDVTLGIAELRQSVVVSAARREELLLESAVPAVLIERAAIEDTAAQTLEQMLVEQAGSGVYVSRSFGIGFPQINGVGGNRVLVLVDGQRQIGTDNGTRDGIDIDQFPAERMERVEIVKGAASALYGSDAMGGVINIITRQPKQPFSFDLNNSYGSFGEGNLGATLGVQKGRFGGMLSGVYQTYDGYDLNPADRQTTGVGGGENAFIDRNLSPSFFADFKPGLRFRVGSNYYRRNATFLNNQGAFSQFSTQERWNIAPTLDWSVGARTALTFRGDSSVARRFDLDRVESLFQAEALGSTLVHATNTIQYGYDGRHKTLRRQGLGSADDITVPLGARGTRSIDVQSIWLQDEWRLIGGRLTLGGGVRFEHNSQFGGSTNPKASAVFRLNSANRLRFSAGRGFRAPDVSELYLGFTPGAFGFVGNPELTPETSWSYTAGWTLGLRRVQYSLDLFLNKFHNGIAFDQVNLQDPFTPFLRQIIPLLGPGQQLFTNRNVGDYDARGANSALTVLLGQGLEATFNYTLLERLTRNSDPAVDGRRQLGLGNMRNSAFAKLGWSRALRLGDRKYTLRANLRGLLRGREPISTTLASDLPSDPARIGQTQFVPAYRTWDLVIGAVAPFREGEVRFEPFVSVNNLGDYMPRGYEYGDGVTVSHNTASPTLLVFREPGRTWKAGVRFHFGR